MNKQLPAVIKDQELDEVNYMIKYGAIDAVADICIPIMFVKGLSIPIPDQMLMYADILLREYTDSIEHHSLKHLNVEPEIN